MTNFGKHLRKLRRERDITQKDLADFLRLKSAAVSKYESDSDNYPSVPTLIKIADYFQVTIDYLLRGVENPAKAEANIKDSNSFAQANIQTNNGDIVVNGHTFSGELQELIRVYNLLKGKGRNELLNFAYKLEEQENMV